MNYRVKNLFAVADSMIRMGARSAASVAEFENTLAGRLYALGSAHSLVKSHLNDVGRAPPGLRSKDGLEGAARTS